MRCFLSRGSRTGSFSISSVFTASAVPTRRATQEGATNEMRHMHSTPPAALPTSPRASAHRCEVADPTAKGRRPTPSPPHRTPGRAWQTGSTLTRNGKRHAEQADALDDVDHGAFQAMRGPNGIASKRGIKSGAKVRLKNGAPTEILSPVTASSAKG